MKTPTAGKIILGIDPGSNVMGFGILEISGNTPKMLQMGVLDLRKTKDHYVSLRKIFDFTLKLIDTYHPDEMAIEAPFFGKNVQSMLKLGRAQGTAITAAVTRDLPIFEYAPLKIKMAITGNGQAAKSQVADMMRRILHIPETEMPTLLDATDGLAAAYCHFLQANRPEAGKKCHGWGEFVRTHPEKVASNKPK